MACFMSIIARIPRTARRDVRSTAPDEAFPHIAIWGRYGAMTATPRAIDPASLSPEDRLVMALMAMQFGGAAPTRADTVVGDRFIDHVRHHRAALWIDAGSAADCGLPHGTVDRLAQLQSREILRRRMLTNETARLARGFAAAGLDMLVLKGAALGALLHGGSPRRTARDIDLLVRPADRDRALGMLRALGYGRDGAAITHPNALELRHAGGMRAELHVRFDDAEELFPMHLACPFETGAEVGVGGAPVRTPGLPLTIVHAASHGAKHLWRRYFWLCDIAAAMRLSEVDWTETFALARHLGVERHLALALVLARDLLGVEPPPGVRSALDTLLVRACRAAAALAPVLAAPVGADEPALRRRMGRLAYAGWVLGLLRRPAARWAQTRLWAGL